MKRNRLIYFTTALIVIALGLLSRRYPVLPSVLGKYPGDALWAIMIFCGIGFLLPRFTTKIVGAVAFGLCCAVEFFQLYHAPWIETVRDTLPGRLILGRGFSWMDISAYAAGIIIACLIEIISCKPFKKGS